MSKYNVTIDKMPDGTPALVITDESNAELNRVAVDTAASILLRTLGANIPEEVMVVTVEVKDASVQD